MKILIKLLSREIELTEEEAKEMHANLLSLFGPPKQFVYIPQYPVAPYDPFGPVIYSTGLTGNTSSCTDWTVQ